MRIPNTFNLGLARNAGGSLLGNKIFTIDMDLINFTSSMTKRDNVGYLWTGFSQMGRW
jgi:hypothetical protein